MAVLTDLRTSFTLVGTPYLEYLPGGRPLERTSARHGGPGPLAAPDRRPDPPDRLIPAAEASGDIGPLTRWILMEACEQANRGRRASSWASTAPSTSSVGARSPRRWPRRSTRPGSEAGQLTLEVTEDAIVDPDSSADLRTLSEMGVQLSVDDVGTNWSSFEPLKRHSISTLKIDGSFIAGLEQTEGINRLVVETVIHMAHSLGMSAIVESVETASQVDIVRSFGADAAQGFFFAQPMSSDDAAAFAAGPDVPQFSLTETRRW